MHWFNTGCYPCNTRRMTANQSTWQGHSSIHEWAHCFQREVSGGKKAQKWRTLPPTIRFLIKSGIKQHILLNTKTTNSFTAPACSHRCHTWGFPRSLLFSFLWQLQLNFDVRSFLCITLYLQTSGFFGCVELFPPMTWKWNPLPSTAGGRWSCPRVAKNCHGETSSWNVFSADSREPFLLALLVTAFQKKNRSIQKTLQQRWETTKQAPWGILCHTALWDAHKD